MKDESFKDFVLDQLEEILDLRARKMFSGFGLYSGKIFFGIISGSVLYFKTDEESRERYRERGSDCFRPSKKQILRNYFEVPANILEDRDALVEWASEAIEVASNS